MHEHFSESNNILVLGAAAAATGTPLVSQYVHGTQVSQLSFTAWVAAGIAADAANQITVEFLESADDVGTGATVVDFEYIQVVKGATVLVDGTGISDKLQQVAAASWVSDVADGLKEMQITVPIRQRQHTPGKPYLAMRVTTGSASRLVTFVAVRYDEQYGVEGQPSLLGN
jgi:hypothetical protein